MVRWSRLALLTLAGALEAAAGTVLAVAVNVATGGTAKWFPTMDRHPLWWVAGATAAVACAGLLIWGAQRWYGRLSPPDSAPPAATAEQPTSLVELPSMRTVSPFTLRVHPTVPLANQDPLGTIEGPRPRRFSLQRRRTGTSGRELPAFVERDKADEIRAWMRKARTDGGLLVLVGDSCTGKTRLLYEMACKVLPDFAVLAPELGNGGPVNLLAESGRSPGRLIIWLDELQRFLGGPYLVDGDTPVKPAAVQQLLDGPEPVIVVGTLWPEYATELRATENDPNTSQPTARYPRAMEILDRRTSVSLATFSRAERAAATALAATDARIARALADPDYNVTEVLAGAPELVRRYEEAPRTHRAVVDAAVDVHRLGLGFPVCEDFLSEASRGYLRDGSPDVSGLGPVIAELSSSSRPVDRATAPLIPVRGGDDRRILGYHVSDFLQQQLFQRRAGELIAGSLWSALLASVRTALVGPDLARAADEARKRGLYRYFVELASVGATRDDVLCSILLADWFDAAGRPDDVDRYLERAASIAAATASGPESSFRERNTDAVRSHHEFLWHNAVDRWVRYLDSTSRPDQALAWLRERMAGPNADVLRLLARRLPATAPGDENEVLLRRSAELGDMAATVDLIDRLLDGGQTAEAEKWLRVAVADNESIAVSDLVTLLREQDRDEEADVVVAGFEAAEYTTWIARRFQRSRPAVGSRHRDIDNAKALLIRADNLRNIDDGQAEALLRRANATGDAQAMWSLVQLLDETDRRQAAEAVLAERSRSGDSIAQRTLGERLSNEGRDEEAERWLRAAMADGDFIASEPLVELLERNGRHLDLELLVHQYPSGIDVHALERMVDAMARHGHAASVEPTLRFFIEVGHEWSIKILEAYLRTQGRAGEADDLHAYGIEPGGTTAMPWY
jgi:hypothetical protein